MSVTWTARGQFPTPQEGAGVQDPVGRRGRHGSWFLDHWSHAGLLRYGRHWPPVRARLAHVAPRRGGVACPPRLGGQRQRARRGATDHLFFWPTLAKLRYSSTRRRRAPGSTYGFNGRSGVPNNRPASTSDVPRADLASGFHPTQHSVTTCRKTPRVITGTPSSSRRSKRRCFQQRRPLGRFSGKLYRVPDGACAGTGLLPSSGRSQIALKCCLRPYDGFTYPPSIKRLAASSERKPSEVPSGA